MLVSVSGYNYTGSSAVQDLLREYSETVNVTQELAFVYLPDGLLDLDYHLNHSATYLSGDAAIGRFRALCQKSDIPQKYRKAFLDITQEYLNELAEETWQGNSCFEGTRMDGSTYTLWRLKNLISSVIFHFFHVSPSISDRTMYLAHHVEAFPEITNRYLNRVAELFAPGDKIAVFNQFFSAYQPEMCMRYTPDAKTIVVDRDPRDVYILGRVKRATHCYPTDDVRKFVTYYRRCGDSRDMTDSGRVLRLQFEDAVYHYEDSVKKVEDFLGIHDHISPRKFFKPEVSINNTQLKVRFPDMAEDIAYIEEALADYLYPFPSIRQSDGNFF